MTNFNEKVNRCIGYSLNSQEFFIYRTRTIKEFARMIHDDLHCRKIAYRLFIQYKTTHRVKKVAGRCFLWNNSRGGHIADPGNGIELRNMKDASQDNCEGFGNPRFDGMESAILVADRYVFAYGDVQIEAFDITQDKKHVICTASLCGSLVSSFGIPAEVFDRLFGLNENFSELDEKQVKTENDLVEKAKRNVELYIDSIYSTRHKVEQATGLIKGALIEIEERKRELNIILSELNNMYYRLML